MNESRPDHWFYWECLNGDCPEGFRQGGSGVCLDYRAQISKTQNPPARPQCPVCTEAMVYKGCREADDGGYGSRADNQDKQHR
jgi:hypothetical protein